MDHQRLERIQLLSSRFHELQGLRVALAGAAITGVMGSYLMAATAPTNSGALIALGMSGVLMAPGNWWLKRYYAARFGRQVWKPGRFSKAFLPVYFVIASLLNAWIPSIPAGAPTAATVAVASTWIGIRDWRWRGYYFAVPVAIAIAFATTASGGGPLSPRLTLAVLFLTVGACLVPIGLLDHLLLVKLVNEAQAAESANAAHRRS
jgi:hypothetical protein